MMNDLDMLVAAWCRTGWMLLLVFTAAVLVVAALRKPLRKVFGAERAFLLWLLPALAVPASLLPHAAAATTGSLPPIVLDISNLPGTFAMAPAGTRDWRVWMAALWLAGVVIASSMAAYAQRRYGGKLRGAAAYGADSTRWPIVRANDSRIGPALVGAWRPRIVVPFDFDVRFDSDERALILAHEAMHARRRDGWWGLLARIVAAIFWFHPLAWWALAALRHDQELACDAGVLREHRGKRRSYGNAMLKTQSAALALPVGCAWSPRHPLTERIAMLKQVQPGKVRRLGGAVLLAVIIPLGIGVAYAATSPASTSITRADRYTLKLELAIDGEAPRLHATTCLDRGKHYDVTEGNIGKLPPWHGKFWITAAPGDMLEIHADMEGGPLEKPAGPRLRTRPGQTATIEFGGERSGDPEAAPGGHIIKVDLTPSVGC